MLWCDITLTWDHKMDMVNWVQIPNEADLSMTLNWILMGDYSSGDMGSWITPWLLELQNNLHTVGMVSSIPL